VVSQIYDDLNNIIRNAKLLCFELHVKFGHLGDDVRGLRTFFLFLFGLPCFPSVGDNIVEKVVEISHQGQVRHMLRDRDGRH